MANKPGKYDHVLPGLPKIEPEDPSYQARVDAAKANVQNRDATRMVQTYADLRLLESKVKSELSNITLQITAYEQLLAESQEARADGWGKYGVKDNALRLPDGTTVRVQLEPVGQIKDKEAFRLWCLKNGYERQMGLMWQTMNGIVKERLLAGEPEPDGCETYARTKIVLTNGKE